MPTIRSWLSCLLILAACSQSREAGAGSRVTPTSDSGPLGDATQSASPSESDAEASPVLPSARCDDVPAVTSEFSRACFQGDVDAVRVGLATMTANERPNACHFTPFAEALAPHIVEPGTPLGPEKARSARKLQIAHMLLDKGIDARATGRYGSTALHEAAGAYYPDREVVRLVRRVLALGPDVDAQTIGGVTPLLLAAERGRTDVVRLLLEAGANPLLGNAYGVTPFSVARQHGHAEIERILGARLKESQPGAPGPIGLHDAAVP